MHAHEERPGKEAGAPGPGARRTPSAPRGPGRGPMGPERAHALQGLVGNRVVARLIKEERHVHGAGCGHGEAGGAQGEVAGSDPNGLATLLDAAMASRSKQLPDPIRAEAEDFYQTNLSPTRLHDDVVAQRATAAMGAEAMTIGHHIFLSPQAARDKELIGHELSHVRDNLAGVPETGTANSAGIPVTDPRQGSERGAATNGAAFKAGLSRAPFSGGGGRAPARPAGSADGGGPGTFAQRAVARTGGLVVARAKNDKSSGSKSSGSGGDGQEKAAPGRPYPSRAAISAMIDEQVKLCTCKQNRKQWGRVTKEVVIRFDRDYAEDRPGQSLRHLARRMLEAVVHAEHREREGTAEQAGKGKDKATPSEEAEGKKAAKPVVEQEIQAMLVNGHLVFASNYNRSVQRLRTLLQELGGGTTKNGDLYGDGLRTLMRKDFGDQEYASSDEETGSESDSETETETETDRSQKSKGKRQAAVRAGRSGKRHKADREPEAGPATGARAAKVLERQRRNRQALLKVREGFTPRTQAMEPVDPDAMDVDGAPETGAFQRDNATLQALRETSHIRLVDVSNEKAQSPGYRDYLASLLAPGGQFAGYAYLVHNGDGAKKVHAEQTLLQMLQNAGFNRDTPHDIIHIRGTKRPCRACLALLRYFQELVGLNMEFNRRENHYYKEALDTGVKNLGGHDGAGNRQLDAHLSQSMADRNRPMYETAPGHTVPAPEGNGLQAPARGVGGGMEQRYRLRVRKVAEDGETTVAFPHDSELQGADTASESEVEDGDTTMTDAVPFTRPLRHGNTPGPAAPTSEENRKEIREARARAREEQVAAVESRLRAAAGEDFWKVIEARTDPNRHLGFFPDALQEAVRKMVKEELVPAQSVADSLRISTVTLHNRLKKPAGGAANKLRSPIDRVPQAAARLEAALPDDLRNKRDALAAENADHPEAKPKRFGSSIEASFTPEFDDFLYEMMNLWENRVSPNSIADKLLIPTNSFKTRHQPRIERGYASRHPEAD
ncbi:DUF4157 domain-containing protein [Streptomyces rimosus]|uniref:eCIS core domain-containing protein n=1 Tax=Streptomyces rimosus TaxID=1927 RepID=UPI00067A836C|nr:DUF4157 domain-containing protein [Streptomyces rimosus]